MKPTNPILRATKALAELSIEEREIAIMAARGYDEDDDQPQTVRKMSATPRRGRPKGSKNKPKAATEAPQSPQDEVPEMVATEES